MSGIDRLRAGDFNDMTQEEQSDGSVIVSLTKRGDPVKYRFRARDLYGPNEEITEEEEIGN